MNMPQFIFYFFSVVLLLAGVMVITARNPVHGVLFLVLAFVAGAVLWMLLQAEFLALTLIFVYVGAVMTLFLFVVMMLNIDIVPLREGFVRYLPAGLLVMLLLAGFMLLAVNSSHFGLAHYQPPPSPGVNYSNAQVLGDELYTKYLYPFELAAVLLLAAIIAAVSLTHRARRTSKSQQATQQVAVRPEERVRLIDMPSADAVIPSIKQPPE